MNNYTIPYAVSGFLILVMTCMYILLWDEGTQNLAKKSREEAFKQVELRRGRELATYMEDKSAIKKYLPFVATTTNRFIDFTYKYNPNITFGRKGRQIILNTETGHINWKGKTPDADARLFWDSVVLAFPGIKREIIEAYMAEQE